METNMFKTMVELQNRFNEQTILNYLEHNLNWDSAIIAESGELLDSLGYKWWKKQVPDMENVKVEAIDLLHFVISHTLQSYQDTLPLDEAIEHTSIEFDEFFTEKDTYSGFDICDLQVLIFLLIRNDYDRFFIMKKIFDVLNMSNEDVYISYIVKNCLNKFRQENGYKQGYYVKDWNGDEDNVIAYRLANEIGVTFNLFNTLYEHLTYYYNEKVLLK